MPNTQQEQLTIEDYNKSAKDWAEAHSNIDFWENELKIFQNLLPSGRVLEVGCGGGRDAELLIKKGYEYTGTDPAENFIKVAQERNPEGKFEIKSANEINYLENSFDGFWASAVLLHIPKDKIDMVLSKLHFVLKSNGVGFIAMKEGTEEIVKEETSRDGNQYKRFWAFYTENEFKQILERNSFLIEKYIYKPMSERTKWLIYFVIAQK